MTIEDLKKEACRVGFINADSGYDTDEAKHNSIEHLMRIFTDDLDDRDDFWIDSQLNYDAIYGQAEKAYDKGFFKEV